MSEYGPVCCSGTCGDMYQRRRVVPIRVLYHFTIAVPCGPVLSEVAGISSLAVVGKDGRVGA